MWTKNPVTLVDLDIGLTSVSLLIGAAAAVTTLVYVLVPTFKNVYSLYFLLGFALLKNMFFTINLIRYFKDRQECTYLIFAFLFGVILSNVLALVFTMLNRKDMFFIIAPMYLLPFVVLELIFDMLIFTVWLPKRLMHRVQLVRSQELDQWGYFKSSEDSGIILRDSSVDSIKEFATFQGNIQVVLWYFRPPAINQNIFVSFYSRTDVVLVAIFSKKPAEDKDWRQFMPSFTNTKAVCKGIEKGKLLNEASLIFLLPSSKNGRLIQYSREEESSSPTPWSIVNATTATPEKIKHKNMKWKGEVYDLSLTEGAHVTCSTLPSDMTFIDDGVPDLKSLPTNQEGFYVDFRQRFPTAS